MNFLQKKLLTTSIFLLLLILFYHNNQVVRKPTQRFIQFPEDLSEYSKKCETLTWVVEFNLANESIDKNTSDVLINKISQSIGLVSIGTVGIKTTHHHLIHPDFRQKCLSLSEKIRKNTGYFNIWSKEKHRINSLLQKHPMIKSFEQQYGKVRTIRNEQASKIHSKTSDELQKKVPNIQYEFSSQENKNKELIKKLELLPNKTHEPFIKSYNSKRFYRLQSFDNSNRDFMFNDPYFPKQWHLVNYQRPGWDLNVSEVWKRGVNGTGINIAVVDDGLDWKSKDIERNYNAAGSIDLIDNQPTPLPTNKTDHHGTRCAGEIAGVANNSFCGVGLAYASTVSGIKLIGVAVTDVSEARAFTSHMHINHIYSCSWGPKDDGATIEGPSRLSLNALMEGVEYGRGGLGSIYVVASGNGGRNGDNCNFDGYANSVYTVTIGSVDEYHKMPAYGEQCASMVAVAFSGKTPFGREIVTADVRADLGGDGCTEHHSGTSAAAPLASALIALMLQVRPCLTWRDVQYIIAVAALKIDSENTKWTRNKAGLWHSHEHGFGIMNAWRLVNTAKIWPNLPWMAVYNSQVSKVQLNIIAGQSINTSVFVSQEETRGVGLETLEYVQVAVVLEHERRGDVRLVLFCPSSTHSILANARPHDNSTNGINGWVFSTVRCWGEEPHGQWTLQVTDVSSSGGGSRRGMLKRWQVILYGSSLTAAEVKDRINLVEKASAGNGVLNTNHSPPCVKPMFISYPGHQVFANNYLEMLSFTGIFFMIMALVDIFDYMCCYRSEKKETDAFFDKNPTQAEVVPLVETR